MNLFQNLFNLGKHAFKKNRFAEEKVQVYIYDPRYRSLTDKIKDKAYAKSIISGACKDVKVCDEEIVQLIIDWIKNPKPIEALTKLLAERNVQMPITLRDFTYEDNYQFTCDSNDGKTFYITLVFGDGWDFSDEMRISYCNKTETYYYNPNKLLLKLQSITIMQDDLKLYSYYSEYFCHRKLTLPEKYEFTLEIDEPEPRDANYVKVLQNIDEIDNYILNLKVSDLSSLPDIYEQIKKLYGFDSDLIRSIESFSMMLTKKNSDGLDEIISEIVMKNGKIKEYVETINDVTIHWQDTGNWSYKMPTTSVMYNKAIDKTNVLLSLDKDIKNDTIDIGSISRLANQAVSYTMEHLNIP